MRRCHHKLKLNFTQRSSFSNCDRWNGAYSGSCWSTWPLRSSYTHGSLRKKPINVTVIVFKTSSDIFYSPVALIFPFLPEVPLVLVVPAQSHMSGVHHSSPMCFTFCGHDWCAAHIKYLQEAHLAQLPIGRYIHYDDILIKYTTWNILAVMLTGWERKNYSQLLLGVQAFQVRPEGWG